MKEHFIHIDKDGNKRYYFDRKMTKLHRKDGPAVEWADGYKAWYLNGDLHREGGPAIEWDDGSTMWYLNGKCHREDGPAIEYAHGYKACFLNGQFLTEKEFNARINKVELTLDEIAEKFDVSVDKLKIKK